MRRNGFTLLEMMVIVAVFGVVSIYVGRILTVNERAYHTIDQTSESQQNLRMLTEMIEDDLRHAGFMVSRATAVCGVDEDQAPDTLYVSDAAAVDPEAGSTTNFEPYPGARVAGLSNLAVGVEQNLPLDSLMLEPAPPSRPAYDLDSDGVPDSDFRPNAGVIVADLADTSRGTACGRIVSVDLANETIRVEGVAGLGGGAPPGAELVAVPANEYRVSGTELLWNGRTLASGIEDLQVVWIFDLDGDNDVDVGPPGTGDSYGGDAAHPYDSEDYAGSLLRQIRVAAVSRSRREDPSFTGQPLTPFNRQPIAATDGYRRRILETRVRLRNIETRLGT